LFYARLSCFSGGSFFKLAMKVWTTLVLAGFGVRMKCVCIGHGERSGVLMEVLGAVIIMSWHVGKSIRSHVDDEDGSL